MTPLTFRVEIPSSSTPGRVYTARRDVDGRLDCDCPHFQRRLITSGRPCKHLARAIRLTDRPIEALAFDLEELRLVAGDGRITLDQYLTEGHNLIRAAGDRVARLRVHRAREASRAAMTPAQVDAQALAHFEGSPA